MGMRKTVLAALCIALTNLLASTPSAAAPPSAGPPDRRFGAVETYDASAAATEMGVGWTRIPFLWAQMQPSGTHEWLLPISDEALALEIAQGRQPVGLVITTPGWATDMNIGPGVPYGLYTGHNDPNNLLGNFLRQLITTYAGRIDNWIIWNEPDVWDSTHPGYTWGGSVADFLQLQRVAYATIKEANPGATVIFSGTSYWWDAAYGRDLYFRRYLDALIQDGNALGNNYYCDAVALHVYFQPDFVHSITALYHQLMREHGFDKPVWIVETNAAPSLDPQMPAPNARFAITLEEQAAYVIQAFAMGIAGGATRIGVFKMIDTPTDLAANPEPFGLVRADGSRRPAFNAYRVATTYMAGFQGGQLEQRPEVSIVTISRSGGTTTVLWTRTPSPATVQVPAHAAAATLVDMWGNRQAISASGGVYTLQLPGASCTHSAPCIIGGPPYLVVEGQVDTAPPLPAQPPPPATASEGQLETSSEQDTDTAQESVYVPPTPTPTPWPAYSVNLRPIEMKGARDVWNKRALSGYQIQLIAGPPFHLYLLTVVDRKVTEARRSLEPLPINPDDLDRLEESASPITMTTLYNRRGLAPYTVEGLFDRVTRYYEERPTCDTEVTVQLNGDWAFPRRIVERQADDCQADAAPSELTVVAFATLTPTLRAVGTTAQDEAASPTVAASLAPPTVPVIATATSLPTPTGISSHSATPAAPSTSSDGISYTWLLPFAGVVAIGAFLIWRNGKNVKRSM
jgi:hypothetical protein